MGDKSAFVGGMKLKISELGKVITGNTPSKKIKEFWDKDDVGFVKPDIISDEHIVKIKSEDCNEFISNAAISKARIVPKNSIFVTCIGNIGKIGVATENLAFNQQINAIIPNENVNLDYLCYAIFANKTRLQDIANAPIVPLLNKSQFSEFELEFDMDINTQTRIVHELNTVSNIILKYKQELLLLDELVRARFVEMFGDPIENQKDWEVVKIRDIVTDVRYGTSKPAVEGGRYPYLRMNNLTVDGGLDLSDLKYIDIPDNEIEKCVVRKGDILFNRTNSIDLIGKTAVFNLLDDMVIAGYIIRIRLNNQILPDVFSQYMNLEVMKKVLRGMAKGAVNQANINAQELQSIKVYIPDMELQKQYVEFKEEIDKSRSRIQKSLEESQELFDSLMQEYFG